MALKVLKYWNAVLGSLKRLEDHAFTQEPSAPTVNLVLQEKMDTAFEALVREELPALITRRWIQAASLTIRKRVTGTLPEHLQQLSEGLAEVFCLTDPPREDNPINSTRTTQYGVKHVIRRNCRLLQGPKTNPASIDRIRDKLAAGKEHHETILNYRRRRLPVHEPPHVRPVARQPRGNAVQDWRPDSDNSPETNPFSPQLALRHLAEVLTAPEIEIVRNHGGGRHSPAHEDETPNWAKPDDNPIPRPLFQFPLSADMEELSDLSGGIFQTPVLSRIGGFDRVRQELEQGFKEGGGVVTAKMRWLTRSAEGRTRWVHGTPLVGSNGRVGVWMVVLVDDQEMGVGDREGRGRVALVVEPGFLRGMTTRGERGGEGGYDAISLASLSHLDLNLPPGHHGEKGGAITGR
ncbi:hypothetical protein QC762_202790 [Podospora pseudocomata]|uniref:Uncharacterized protein n=1 Tax=Podospora pseudocomata TaxID=2093779 RepID=A0ABR0GQX9_9PEZI|nr:hypothetical protein QC762_202790 [Podospora pseudocomata]